MLYCPDNARASVAPSLLATALLLQVHDKASDAEAKARVDRDIRWKVALGIEIEDRPFAKSVFRVSRAQIILHDVSVWLRLATAGLMCGVPTDTKRNLRGRVEFGSAAAVDFFTSMVSSSNNPVRIFPARCRQTREVPKCWARPSLLWQ